MQTDDQIYDYHLKLKTIEYLTVRAARGRLSALSVFPY
jgi:hypothetical protein